VSPEFRVQSVDRLLTLASSTITTTVPCIGRSPSCLSFVLRSRPSSRLARW
jgi:hypothetical protein